MVLAKETMQAVSEAEQKARETVLSAKEEGQRILREAKEQAEKLTADAKKEALKRTEVLCGVARADGEKLKAVSAQETKEEQNHLKQAAASSMPQAAATVRRIILEGKKTEAEA